jgi:O-antigen/teichoic acid export membrane protein
MIIRTLSANLAIQLTTFATSVLSARILGPVGRGELALVLLYPQLVAGVGLLGVDRAVAILSGNGELSRPASAIGKLVLLLSFPVMATGYAVVYWRVSDIHLAGLATLYLAYVPAMFFFLLAVSLFNGVGDFQRFNLARLSYYLINLVLVLVIWWAAPILVDLLDWVVFANLVSVYGVLALAVGMLHNLQPTGRNGGAACEKDDVRTIFHLAVVFVLPVALAHVSTAAYQIILDHQMGVKALGFFVVFFAYSRLLSPLGSAIGSHVFHLGIAGEHRNIARIFRQSLVVYILCAMPLALLAGTLIPIIFGRQFVVQTVTVGVLLVSSLLALLADTMGEYLNGQRKVAADSIGRIIYLSSLAILGGMLVPVLGLLGMAQAVAISDMLRCLYLVNRVKRETQADLAEFWLITKTDLNALSHAGKGVLQGLLAWR